MSGHLSYAFDNAVFIGLVLLKCGMVHKVHYSETNRSANDHRSVSRHQRGDKNMKLLLLRLWKDEEGQDLTEYALLLVLLTLAAIGSLSQLATAINGVFSKAITNLT